MLSLIIVLDFTWYIVDILTELYFTASNGGLSQLATRQLQQLCMRCLTVATPKFFYLEST